MRLSVKHAGGVRFTANCRGHEVTIDQPESNRGEDAGMTPPEMFAASLAGCIGFYVATYCDKAGICTDGLEVGVDWEVVDDPRRVGSISFNIDLPGLPENRRKALEKVANSCLLHATLHQTPEMTLTINNEQV